MRWRTQLTWRSPCARAGGARCCPTRPAAARSVVAGEGGGRVKAVGPGDLADELRGRERAAAWQGEQRGATTATRRSSWCSSSRMERLRSRRGRRGRGRSGRRCPAVGEPGLERVEHDGPPEGPRPRLVAGVQLVEVPAEAVDCARALGDQVLAVVDEQAQLALLALERRGGQVRVGERGAGDRERVVGVALALLPPVPAGPGHQPCRHPGDHLPARRRSADRRRDRWRVSSSANRRSGKRPAHRTSSRWPSGVVASVVSATRRPLPSAATAVWVRLCKSIR